MKSHDIRSGDLFRGIDTRNGRLTIMGDVAAHLSHHSLMLVAAVEETNNGHAVHVIWSGGIGATWDIYLVRVTSE